MLAKAKSGLKKIGGYTKKAGSYLWNHKKRIAAYATIAGVGVGAAMATGYLPTPEIVQSATQVISTTVAEHPTESLVAGSAVGGIVGFAALKKGYKGTKRVYSAVKSVPKTAKTLASEAVAKVSSKSKGGEQPSQPSQDLTKINWDKAKFFIAET